MKVDMRNMCAKKKRFDNQERPICKILIRYNEASLQKRHDYKNKSELIMTIFFFLKTNTLP